MRKCAMKRFMPVLVLACLGIWSFDVHSESNADSSAIPHLDQKGRQGFEEFQTASPHRAFAIATGGAWAWVSGHASGEEASAQAVADCAQYTTQKCLPYAIDEKIVLDVETWAASWGPYLRQSEAATAPEGVMTGNRFPDLVLTTPEGRPIKVSDLKGRVVFLHFWGSWCPPCQAEFPELQKLYDAFAGSSEIAFVLVQTREDIAKSRRWARKKAISMPLYDSGTKGRKDTAFQLANGGDIEDRRLAPVFPSTYVLDANGIVIFNHTGPASGWPQYEPQLRHVMGSIGDG